MSNKAENIQIQYTQLKMVQNINILTQRNIDLLANILCKKYLHFETDMSYTFRSSCGAQWLELVDYNISAAKPSGGLLLLFAFPSVMRRMRQAQTADWLSQLVFCMGPGCCSAFGCFCLIHSTHSPVWVAACVLLNLYVSLIA